MEFRSIELNDREWVECLRDTAVNPMTVLSFQALYTWKDTFDLSICRDSDFFAVYSGADGGYYYPCGDREKCRNFIMEQLGGKKQLKLLYVPESEIEWLRAAGFSVVQNQDTSEYIYESHALAMQGEGCSRNFRRKCKNFYKRNTFTVSGVDMQSRDMLAAWFTGWEKNHLWQAHDDRQAVWSAIKNMDSLSMSGVLLQTSDGEWAFLLGYESTPKIYDMAFVKYSQNISEDVVAVCISETAKKNCEQYPYINLEDDMGIEGLRTMKTLYKPAFMLESYTAYSSDPAVNPEIKPG